MSKRPRRIGETEILNMSKRKEGFHCHRYKWSHDYIRKLCRRLDKEKKIKVVGHSGDSFVYKFCGE